ncbi:MAG: proline--tRNA ligase [Alphaproteobacteria bacterium]
MKYSNFFIPTQNNVSSDVKMKSHELMIKSGMIRQETSGIYTWLPLGYRVLKKVIKIIENIHEQNNVNQILMPTIQSSDIWKISDRYDSYGKEMLKIRDRHEKELLYGPTNEEMVTAIGKHYIKSYKSLPLKIFHVQNKFRDEIRPRFGVMRAREFIMKDAYSFDISDEESEKTYHIFYNLYLNIFEDLNMQVIPVRAPTGEIGGDLSHEFHLITDSGESEILIKDDLINEDLSNLSLDQILNIEAYTDDYYQKNNLTNNLNKFKSIELAHIFLFGTKYSNAFDFDVDSGDGKLKPFMGSYGIGISRIPAAFIESSHDERGIIWSKTLSPFDIHFINLLHDNSKCIQFCDKFYEESKNKNIDILLDDRKESAGKKFVDADLIGIPIQIICGNMYLKENKLSVIFRDEKNEQQIHADKLFEFLLQHLK